MHNISMRLLGILLLVTIAGAADNTLTPAEKSAGWKLLFDGKSFAGWEDPAQKTPPGDSFLIEDGCLKATRKPQIVEDLFTLDNFTDFELEFDWKISPGGNSGIKYRIQDRVWLVDAPRGMKFEDVANISVKSRQGKRSAKGQEYVIGFEYQALDNERHPDAKRGANHQSGALYDVFPPIKDATKPVGEFNHSRLVVRGDHIEHWLNGVKVVDGSLKDPAVGKAAAARWGTDSPITEMLTQQAQKSTPISLQNHGDEAWFKNIKIRVL
jgi:Domain of Unknown Function (DUF1080)